MYIAKDLISNRKFNLATRSYLIATATIHLLNKDFPNARFTLMYEEDPVEPACRF